MRQAAVDDCLRVLQHFDVDPTQGTAIDVGGTADVWLGTSRGATVQRNPLLELVPRISFLDRGFNVDTLRTSADEQIDFLDARQIGHLHGKFDMVFCFDTLEHVSNPFRFCDHLIAITRPGGHIYVSTIFAWEYHPSPEDYFRFSPAALRQLFTDGAVERRSEATVLWAGWGSDAAGVSALVHRGPSRPGRSPEFAIARSAPRRRSRLGRLLSSLAARVP